MIIKKVAIPNSYTSPFGLAEVNMSRLGRIVAIGGRNGSGKSRFLDLLSSLIVYRNSYLANMDQWENSIENLKNDIKNHSSDPVKYRTQIKNWSDSKNSFEKQILDGTNKIELFESHQSIQIKPIGFVPKNLTFIDPGSLSKTTLRQSPTKAFGATVEAFAEHCLPYIQNCQDLWFEGTHQNSQTLEEQRHKAIKSYVTLASLIERLLGAALERGAEGDAHLFGRPIAGANLSHGQIVILQLAVALHVKGADLDNTIFILDELENYLHPSASIDIFNAILNSSTSSQIWIATHSIPLLAHINTIQSTALWFMDGGKISHAGRRPENVLKSLLGDDETIGQISRFTGFPAQVALANFAVQSLLPPATLSAEDNDPQIHQISEILADRPNKPINLLDFGAGKSRLLEGLGSLIVGKISESISYFAYDIVKKDELERLEVISEFYEESFSRNFNSEDELLTGKDDETIDVVVMCNSLHEISPRNWLETLTNTDSALQRKLKNDGYLLLVEDQQLPIGEKAHEYGFILLDTAQLKTLFKVTEEDVRHKKFVMEQKKEGRLKAHLISKDLLRRATTASRDKSIAELLSAANRRCNEIRQKEPNYVNGQLLGFWTQLLANAYSYTQKNPSEDLQR